LKKKLHEREIPAVKKHEIYRAYEDKQRLKHDEGRLREERKELEEKEHVYNQRQNGHNKQQEACARMQEQSQERFFQIYRRYERSAEEERELEHFHGTIKKEIKKIQQELEAEQTNHLAHQLAQRLQEGEPCPVCGSAKHPQPVQRKTGNGSQLEDRLHQLENWAERVHEAKGGMERSKWQLQHLANRMTEGLSGQADQAVKQVAAHTEAAGTEVSSGTYGHASHAVHSSVEQEQPRALPSLDESKWEEQATNRLRVMEEEKQAVQDLERLVQREQQQLSEAREQLRESELSIENIKTDISTRQEKVSLLKSRTENAKLEWQKAYPGYPYESIEDDQKKVRQLDEEASGGQEAGG
jgi:DNA repair protein SbcC/Rad50